MEQKFELKADFKPTGDQPAAIEKLTKNILDKHKQFQVLLGVTGSGKTFTVANVIAQINRPVLVISHNKTLAAQLYQEFKQFFPNNAVHYFVSYYDYYQPEAYIPQRDLYIEKDASINEEIDRLRLAATSALLSRQDVIVVASVSAIYNIGSPIAYRNAVRFVEVGQPLDIVTLSRMLVNLFYERNDIEFKPGTFRVRGGTIEIYLAYAELGVRIHLDLGVVKKIELFNPVDGTIVRNMRGYPEIIVSTNKQDITKIALYPAKHYVIPPDRLEEAINNILSDLKKRVEFFKKQGKDLEAHRLEQRTLYDIEMIRQIGYCKGIENYSVYFDGRQPGDPPYSLLDYYPDDYLLIIDESHMTIPQIRGMYNGDYSRKKTLIDYGFRLPTALDNRPLKFEEFEARMGYTIFMSATPEEYELSKSCPNFNPNFPFKCKEGIAEQLIRPTGIVDPKIYVRPAKNQVKDVVSEIKKVVKKGGRVLITTLTKRMAEELAAYLEKLNIKVTYLHSDIKTLERTEILRNLRLGKFEVLVGINLLREGLDLPEVALVAILDADKEGFLRSRTSLIQTMGRAARNVNGYVILYADTITKSMQQAIDEVNRRRAKQLAYNKAHGIVPKTVVKDIQETMFVGKADKKRKNVEKEARKLQVSADIEVMVKNFKLKPKYEQRKILKWLRAEMKRRAEALDFESAIELRDLIKNLTKK